MSEDLRAALDIQAKQNLMSTAQCRFACSSANSIARHNCSCVILLQRKQFKAFSASTFLSSAYFAAINDDTVASFHGAVICNKTGF